MERQILKEISNNSEVQNQHNRSGFEGTDIKSTTEPVLKKEQQVLSYEHTLENHHRTILNVNAPSFVPSSHFDDSFNVLTSGVDPNGNSTFLGVPETAASVCSEDDESFVECQSFVDNESGSLRGEAFYSQGNSAVNSTENLLKLNETEPFLKTDHQAHVSPENISSSTFIGDWNVSEITREGPSESLSTINNTTKINDTDNITIPSTNTTAADTLNRSFVVDSLAFSVSESDETSAKNQQSKLNETSDEVPDYDVTEKLSNKELKNIENICVQITQLDLQVKAKEETEQEKSDEESPESTTSESLPSIVVEQFQKLTVNSENCEIKLGSTSSEVNFSSPESYVSAIDGTANTSSDAHDKTITIDVQPSALTSDLSVEIEEDPTDGSLPYFNASNFTPTNQSFESPIPQNESALTLHYNKFSDLQNSIDQDQSINNYSISEANMPELFSSPPENGVGFYKDQSPNANEHGDEMIDVNETMYEGRENQSMLSPTPQVFAKPQSPQEKNVMIDENFSCQSFDVTFKTPSLPPSGSFGNKRKSEDGNSFGSNSSTTFSDDEFRPASSGLLQFSDSDFDFLLSKESRNAEEIRRDSVLSTFDPLLQKLVPVTAVTAKRLSGSFVSNNKQIPTQVIEKIIEEAATINESFESSYKVCSSVNGSGDSQQAAKTFVVEEKPKSQNDSASSINSQEEYATMSVGVMTDMLIENNLNDNTNFQKMSEQNAELEKKIQNEVTKTEDIEKKLRDAEQREEALLKRISEKDRNITKMTGIVEAYEKAIAELISEKEQIVQNYEKKCAELQADSDSNAQHLASLETTFSDVHIKYERTKKTAKELSDKVEQLLQEKQENLDSLHVQEARYEKMKGHAMSQLDSANNILAEMTKNHQSEVTKLKAQLKKEEISRASTQEQLQQKSRENSELMKICDELINQTS